MPKPPVKRRAYQSNIRAASAQGTRDAITDAARRLFVARGYAGTPIELIAREAGVAVPTVYAVFGTKRAVLEAMLDAMDREADAEGLEAAMRAGSAAVQAGELAKFLSRLFVQNGDLIAATRAASAGDAGMRDLARKGTQRHRRGTKKIAEAWARAGALREGLTASDAAAILAAIANHGVYADLKESGWSAKRYEAWLADTITRLMLTSDA